MEKIKKRKVASVEKKGKKASSQSESMSYAKRPMSAFFFYAQKLREDIKKDGGSSGTGENIAKLAGKKWKELSEDGRKPFIDQATADKARYEKELASGKKAPPRKTKNVRGAKSKPGKEKDPNKPKRANSAYLFFSSEFRKSPAAANVKHTDVMKLAAAKWKSLSESERKKYEEMERKDKERYRLEMEEYNKTSGGKKKPSPKGGKKPKPSAAKIEEPSSSSEKDSEVEEEEIVDSGEEEDTEDDE